MSIFHSPPPPHPPQKKKKYFQDEVGLRQDSTGVSWSRLGEKDKLLTFDINEREGEKDKLLTFDINERQRNASYNCFSVEKSNSVLCN